MSTGLPEATSRFGLPVVQVVKAMRQAETPRLVF